MDDPREAMAAISRVHAAIRRYSTRRGVALPTETADELAACLAMLDHFLEDRAPSEQVSADLQHVKQVMEVMLANLNPEASDVPAGMRIREDAFGRAADWIDTA